MRGKIRKRNFHAPGSDFTAHRGRSVGVFLHIPRGREGARRKQATDTMETTKFFRDNLSKSMKKFNFASDKRS
jgi:hypothetical protein